MSTEPVPSGAKAPDIASTPDERSVAMICHIGGVLTSVIVPLIFWQMKKDKSPYITDQAREALNFQLLVLIVYAIAAPLVCAGGLGFFLMIPASLASLVLGIMATMAANDGKVYRYPTPWRLIK